jgi:hypothetical protein
VTETLPEGTIAVFATLCGATVALIETPDADRARRGSWNCLGCGLDSIHTDVYDARGKANQHAGTCRSKPLPTT